MTHATHESHVTLTTRESQVLSVTLKTELFPNFHYVRVKKKKSSQLLMTFFGKQLIPMIFQSTLFFNKSTWKPGKMLQICWQKRQLAQIFNQ